MNKKIKGHELMKLIAENKIKKGQEFVFTIKNTLTKKRIYWSGKNLIYCDTGKFVFGDNADIYFLLGDIEILEDEEEIDINDLEDLPLNYKEVCGLSIDATFIDFHNNTRAEINKIIKYLKQLDKKINKEE